jgi:nucleotide-binding universal stress UspA family protein
MNRSSTRPAEPPPATAWAGLSPVDDPSDAVRPARSGPPYRRVLCATDLSPTGDSAVDLAYRLAADGGSVCLLHVYEHPYAQGLPHAFSSPVPPTAAEVVKACEKRAQEHLDRLPFRAGRPDVTTTEVLLHHPNAAAAIEEHVRIAQSDVVVMGTHGRTGLGRLLMGSVAMDVLKRARVPVVLFHDPRVEA